MLAEVLECPRCKHRRRRDEWATRYGIITCGSCLQSGFVILPETIRTALCICCNQLPPRADDEFCQPCVDAALATAPESGDDDDDGFDCRNVSR